LTWQEIRELRENDIRFGSHTVNHPKLYELPWNTIESELKLSKERIEQELGEEITTFAYPYAFPQEDQRFVSRFTDMLQQAGYRNCLTTVIGRLRANDDPFRLKRLPANSCDDEALFTAKLEGAYDWLSVVQGFFRSGKAWLKRERRPMSGPRSGTLAELNRS
jgi:peptidoglycan/xylan/chitin deacetylase (PgdA/CDA1 family)